MQQQQQHAPGSACQQQDFSALALHAAFDEDEAAVDGEEPQADRDDDSDGLGVDLF
jgi:hypothetical protein